jgi:UDP-N-acetyl-D-mannosaminuronic acid transferase (WecB/TagA/CpsF family)
MTPQADTRRRPAPATLAHIDGQPVNLATQADTLAAMAAAAQAGRGFTLFTLNLDHLVKRRADPTFRAAYSRATFITADGAPVAQAGAGNAARHWLRSC